MDDVEFINERAEENDLLNLRPEKEPRRGWMTSFLLKRKIAVDEPAALKIIGWMIVVLLILSALIFSYYGYGVDQFESVPNVPAVPANIQS